MTEIAAFGHIIAKNWSQVQAADAHGQPIARRKLRSDQVRNCFAHLPLKVFGIEACSTSHHRASVIGSAGHRVKLLPPTFRSFVST